MQKTVLYYYKYPLSGMKIYKNRYTQSILITLLTVLFISCSDNSVNTTGPQLPIAIINDPMWPQTGYNAQNTSNPYAPRVICNSVNLGQIDWYYEFPNTSYSDGAEFCVDSKNNIYYFSQQNPLHKIYKFRPDGSVIWIIDSLNSWNHAYVSLSSDEAKIYFNSGSSLYCHDSSGNFLWSVENIGMYPKPSIGKDGTIYTLIGHNAAAVNPDGSIKWISGAAVPPIAIYLSLDREENIYVGGDNITKLDKNGNTVWTFSPDSVSSLISGAVIDGYGNLYFTNYFDGTKLYSLTKDGILRWIAPSSSYSPPAIDIRNRIYTVGMTVNCYDTSGQIIWTKPMPSGIFTGESPVLDDEQNIYFITDSPIKAVSFDNSGNQRWVTDIFNSASLPKPALMPMGRMLIAPKRAYKIACVK
jgi:hypothetical protein